MRYQFNKRKEQIIMKHIFIYYNNGNFELTDSPNLTLLHMIEMKVIKIMVDVENKKAWVRNEDGIAKEVKIPTWFEPR